MGKRILMACITWLALHAGPAFALGGFPPVGPIDFGSYAPPKPIPQVNLQGMWWNVDESGWGVNITHQGTHLFATLFTYDLDGSPMWFVVSDAAYDFYGTYSGKVHRATGPYFSDGRWDSSKVQLTQVGIIEFHLNDNEGYFKLFIGNSQVSKRITRYLFNALDPDCSFDATPDPVQSNYTDMWWNAAESGWGVNVTHQGDVLFSTLFMYRADGKADWVFMAQGDRTNEGSYTGVLYRSRGPAYNATPWDSSKVVTTAVGTATFTFADNARGTFTFTVDGVTRTKAITRYAFAKPPTVCRVPIPADSSPG